MRYGQTSSPLIVDKMVIVTGGELLNGPFLPSLLAFDKGNGDPLWQCVSGKASYASPSVVTLAGVPQILQLHQDFLAGHDLADGHILWQFRWSHGMWPKNSQIVPIGNDRKRLLACGLIRAAASSCKSCWVGQRPHGHQGVEHQPKPCSPISATSCCATAASSASMTASWCYAGYLNRRTALGRNNFYGHGQILPGRESAHRPNRKGSHCAGGRLAHGRTTELGPRQSVERLEPHLLESACPGRVIICWCGATRKRRVIGCREVGNCVATTPQFRRALVHAGYERQRGPGSGAGESGALLSLVPGVNQDNQSGKLFLYAP